MNIENYIEKLKRMDWYFNMSDDYSMYASGRRRMDELKALREELDPDYTVWNEYAPADFKLEK